MSAVPGTPNISKVTYDIRFLAGQNTGFDKVEFQVVLSTDTGLTSDQIAQIAADGSLFEQGLTVMVQKIIANSAGAVTGVSATKRYDGFTSVVLA